MKWGILSTGVIAHKFAGTIRSMEKEGQILQAVGSRNRERAAAFAEEFAIPVACSSYEELLASPEIEAVYIGTPNHLHAENCRAALEAGKHVLCEKPFTIRAEQAEALYALADQKGLLIMEAFWVRYLPLYAKLKEVIEENAIGKIKHVRCEYGFIAKGVRLDRKMKSALGGGALLDIGIYNLGFLHAVMGERPEQFCAEVTINEWGTDSFSAIQLAYPGGRTAHTIQTIGMQIDREARLFGEAGSIVLPDFQLAQTMTVQPTGREPYTIQMPVDINGFEYEIREFSRLTEEDLSESPLCPRKDTLSVQGLMDEIRDSWQMRFECEE